jgi:hypothetical protein
MPVTETIELYRKLADELRGAIERIVANAVVPPLFGAAEPELIVEAMGAGGLDPDIEPLLAAARTRVMRAGLEAQHLGRLRESLPLQVTTLRFSTRPAGPPRPSKGSPRPGAGSRSSRCTTRSRASCRSSAPYFTRPRPPHPRLANRLEAMEELERHGRDRPHGASAKSLCKAIRK